MQRWTRRAWCEDADKALGPLIKGGREWVLEKLRDCDGMQLFEVDGPAYSGWFLIHFVDAPSGLVCDCIAFAGKDTAAGLRDLRDLVKNAGAVALTCSTEQEAVARMYRGQGWKITEYFLRFEIK